MKMNILKINTLVIAVLWTACACDTDVKGTLYDGDAGYAFSSHKHEVELLVSDGNRCLIPVCRNSPEGTAQLAVFLHTDSENAEGVFHIENPVVTFKEGETVADIVVGYSDINDLGLDEDYRFTLSFDSSLASPSGISSVSVSARRKLVFRNIGNAVYTCTFFTQMGAPAVLEVPVEKADGANVYRLLDVFSTGYPIEFSLDESGENVKEFKMFPTGVVDNVLNQGMIYFEYAGTEGSFRREGNTLYFHYNVCVILAGGVIGDVGVSDDKVELPE